ncbi:MAG: hypothetical protein ABDH37_01140 [Candidatus Hydrothermales bacterium]
MKNNKQEKAGIVVRIAWCGEKLWEGFPDNYDELKKEAERTAGGFGYSGYEPPIPFESWNFASSLEIDGFRYSFAQHLIGKQPQEEVKILFWIVQGGVPKIEREKFNMGEKRKWIVGFMYEPQFIKPIEIEIEKVEKEWLSELKKKNVKTIPLCVKCKKENAIRFYHYGGFLDEDDFKDVYSKTKKEEKQQISVKQTFIYIDNENVNKILRKAIEKHKALFKTITREEEKEEIERILRTIENVFKELNLNKNHHKMGNSILKEYFSCKKFLFQNNQISSFYTALKTKGFVILAGLSGIGKTKMAQIFVEIFGNKSFFLSVRPDWKDSKSLLGYYNPIMNRFEEPTQFLRFILEAIIDYKENKDKALPYFVILDEMNLARVEYYFAEFLSVLESGRDEDGFTKEGIKIQISGKDIDKQKEVQKKLFELLEQAGYNTKENIIDLKLPPNLYFIGTVNIDETTFMFSPKVLDRAFTIEFKEVDFDKYKENLEKEEKESITEISKKIKDDFILNGKFLKAYPDKNRIKEAIEAFPYFENLKNLSQILEPYGLHFAYRVIDEIALFYKNAIEAKKESIISFENDEEIIDLAILMKVLPKFHGNRAKLEEPLLKVLYWCMEPETKEIKEENIKKIKEITEKNHVLGINEFLEKYEKQHKEKIQFKFPHTARKVLEMLYKLYTDGYASYL